MGLIGQSGHGSFSKTPRSGLRNVLTCALLFCAFGARPALGLPRPGDKWIEARTEHFTFFSNAKEKTADQIALNFERLRATLDLLSGDREVETTVPSYVFVFKSKKSFGEYVESKDRSTRILGRFEPRPDGNYVAIDASPERPRLYVRTERGVWGQAYETVFHEYMHYYLRNIASSTPLWIDEGVAGFYESFRVNKNTLEIGRPVPDHVRWLRQNAFIPLDRLFTADRHSPEYTDPDTKVTLYAQSWALIHYLIGGDPESWQQLPRFIRAIEAGQPTEEVLREIFQISYSTLETDLRRYVEGAEFPFLEYTIDDMDIANELAWEAMPRADVLFHLGDFLVHSAINRLPEAEEHFRAAVELRPDHTKALAGLAVLLERQGRTEEALAYYARVLEQVRNPSVRKKVEERIKRLQNTLSKHEKP